MRLKIKRLNSSYNQGKLYRLHKFRNDASTDDPRLFFDEEMTKYVGRIPEGSIVFFVEEREPWRFKIIYGETIGWVMGYLSIIAEPT